MANGTLYLTATPIGNLGDITLRALETLRQTNLVVAEDTRRTRALLSHHGVLKKRVIALHAHATESDMQRVLTVLREGGHVTYVTDAGMPCVSDPGARLVQRCAEEGITVTSLPGASAVTSALALSGFGDAGFWFVGFLPRKGLERRHLLNRILQTPEAVVVFESPQRLSDTLAELAVLMPDRQAFVGRELTKLHEQCLRGTVSELAAAQDEYRGEISLVLGPLPEQARGDVEFDESELNRLVAELLSGGQSVKDVANCLAQRLGLPKRDLYARALKIADSAKY